MVECTVVAGDANFFVVNATTASNGRIRVRRNTGNLVIDFAWDGNNNFVSVSLGTFPTNPFAVEVIYDATNATDSLKLRARAWDIGATAGSFTNTGDTATDLATDEFTALSLNDGNQAGPKFGRIAFSNDTTEDLSNLSEGAPPAAVPPIAPMFSGLFH
jgi:hypothetical protein